MNESRAKINNVGGFSRLKIHSLALQLQLFRGAGQEAGEHSRNRTRSKQTRYVLQTALNIKGYPHLPVSFHRRLQVNI